MTEKKVNFESIHYIDKPLSATSLKQLLRAAGLKPEDAVRKNEPAYREYVAGKSLTGAELIEVMAEHPELMQRPFVVRGKKAVLARPIENLRQLDI